MKINFDLNINLWTLIALVIGVFWFVNRGNLKDDIDRWQTNYTNMEGSHKEYTSAYDKMIVSYRGIIELKQKELNAALKSDSIQRELTKKYRKASTAVKVEWKFHPKDTVYVEVPMYVEKDTTAQIWHDCFEVDVGIENGRLSLYNLYIENRQDIVLGARKKGVWKTEQAFDIRNTNPCITTTGMTTYNVTVQKKWHEKWWITAPVGFATGYIMGRIE